MWNFLSDVFSLGLEGLEAVPNGKKKIEEVKDTFRKLKYSEEEVSIDEFMKMYNVRIHNFDSKQDDIKLMKQYDFEGVYILHNCTRNIYYIGNSRKVFHKIERQFKGYEDPDVYNEWSRKHIFTVKIYRFEESNYSSINKLKNNLMNEYEAIEVKSIKKKKKVEIKEKFEKQEKKSNFLKRLVK